MAEKKLTEAKKRTVAAKLKETQDENEKLALANAIKKQRRVSAVVKSKTFDTGLQATERSVILIPGRGRVVIPAPVGDLYFKGSYTQDTGPTHVKSITNGDMHFKGAYTKDTGPTHVKSGANNDLYFNGSHTKDTGPTHVKSGSNSDLYFKGSYTKDTGPTHVKSGSNSDLYFKGSYTKDTGPTHVKSGSNSDLYFKGAYTKDTGPTHVKSGANADLHFKGSYTKDTGPTHVQTLRPTGRTLDGRIQITGVLKKKDYLYLARRGCVIKDGVITVPAEHVEAIRAYLKIK